jgi:glucose-1-phosphate thymidylyltransferase
MKGILLAGGSGTRLFPTTSGVSKQLLNVYDKPVIYYPLSALMLAGIREIMIISTARDIPNIKSLLGDGQQLGIKLEYKVQQDPNGIPEAFLLSKDFIKDSSVCLILGDNLFYGQDLIEKMRQAVKLESGSEIFAYRVRDPERYGVVEFDQNYKALSLEEKPEKPKSNWAVTGLYFYDKTVVEKTENLEPSPRGELEITDLNKRYLEEETLRVNLLSRGVAWLDTGTPDSLLEASSFVQTIEKRQGLKIACLEEVAYNMKFITKQDLKNLGESYPNSLYSEYIKQLSRGINE